VLGGWSLPKEPAPFDAFPISIFSISGAQISLDKRPLAVQHSPRGDTLRQIGCILTVRPHRAMKPTRFTICILLAVSILSSGCTSLLHPINSTFARHSNPIAGWKSCWSQDPEKLAKAIRDDYQDYIQKLPQKVRNRIGPIQLFEDGTGKYAVTIAVDSKGTEWTHVLIYDRANKRVEVIKYVSGHYMS
jgi:hypothetical protein